MKSRNTLGGIFFLSIAVAGISGVSHAAVFKPVIDEFWIVKNGVEIFRDSFNDGAPPPSGPDGATTYSTGGSDAGLVGGEAGGKLTMTPSLGLPTLITGTRADTFTGALRTRSTNPANGNFLGLADAFTIFAQYDLTTVPGIPGQSFGIRATDSTVAGTGNNVAQINVAKDSVSGNVGVQLRKIDIVGNTSERADFDSIESVLPTAAKIQLSLSKGADSDAIQASYIVYDGLVNVLQMANLDTTLDTSLTPISIYDGENFIRAQFLSTDTNVPLNAVPLPSSFPLFLAALLALGLMNWCRRSAA